MKQLVLTKEEWETIKEGSVWILALKTLMRLETKVK